MSCRSYYAEFFAFNGYPSMRQINTALCSNKSMQL